MLPRLKLLSLFSLTLLFSAGLSTLSASWKLTPQPVQAQTSDARQVEAERLLNLCREHLDKGQPEAALQSCQQALSTYQQIKDRSGEAKSMTNLGIAYTFSGQSNQAISTLEAALEIAREAGERRVEAIALLQVSYAYFFLGQSQQGTQVLKQALTVARDIKDSELEQRIRQVLSEVEKSPISPQKVEAALLLRQGSLQFQTSQYPAAIESWQKALTIYREIGDHNGEAGSLNNLGIAYGSLGEYGKAIDYFQKSLAIKRDIGERNGEANSLMNLGNAYNSLGQYAKAIDYYQQSLAIKRDIGAREGEANSLIGLGSAYFSLGQYAKAIDYYQQSLAIFSDIGAHNGEANSLCNLGIVYRILGQYPKAIDYFQHCLAIKKDIGDRNGEANTLMDLGLVYHNLGQYPKAIEYHQQSLAIFSDIGDRNGEGFTLSNLGYLYEQQEQPELAIIFFKQAVIVREGIRQDIRVLERELQESYTETVAGTYRRLADLLLSQDRIYEAQQVLELLKLQEIQDFTRSQRARGEMPKVVLLPQEKEIIDSYGKLVKFAAEIAKCEQNNCPQLSALRDQRDTLKRQYNQDVKELETAIRQRDAQDDQFLLPTSFNRTADRIIQASDKYNAEPGTAVIYPLVLKDKLWLLWATKGKVIGKREITNVGRKQLNQEVVKLRLFLQDPDSDVAELHKTAQQLYDWLIRPIEGELEAGNIHHLAFSLDRGFRYIPMAVLHDGERYLIEKYTVTTFISAEFTDTQDRLPAKQEETPIIGVGASEFSGYKPLPHVVTEIDGIVRENHPNDQQGIYPGNQFLNEAFTKDALRDNLTGRKLLHIATHGEFVPGNQYDSFLILGDGKKLSIPDIQILDDYLDDVHLVVLSACETAVGESFLTDPKQEEGIEINALSFYFLSGGAKTVMASLWRVDDPSTSQLMQRFYCTLANGNPSITKTQALKKAQESLLKNTPLYCEQSTSDNTDFAHPHYWAPFILIGNGL